MHIKLQASEEFTSDVQSLKALRRKREELVSAWEKAFVEKRVADEQIDAAYKRISSKYKIKSQILSMLLDAALVEDLSLGE